MFGYLLVILNLFTLSSMAMDSPFATGDRHCLLISGEGDLLACGREGPRVPGMQYKINYYGDGPKFLPFKALSPLSVAAGKDFSLVLSSDGKVRIFESLHKRLNTRLRINEYLNDKHIVQIAASAYCACVLSEDGKVLIWHDKRTEFEELKGFKNRIKKIACGYNLLLAIDSDDNLWSAQIDSGFMSWQGSLEEPHHLLEGTKIQSMASGRSHIIILDMNNILYSMGINMEGQLGRVSSNLLSPEPVALPDLNISKIVAGDSFSALLSDEGRVCWFGILSPKGGSSRYENLPTEFLELENQKITNIFAGPLCNSLFIAKGAKLIAYGNDDCGLDQEFTNLIFERWTPNNHFLQSSSFQEKLYYIWVCVKTRFPKIPNEVLFLLVEQAARAIQPF